MGLFDFLKPKKDPLDDPKFRPLMIKGMAAQLATRCGNLKAVGRETEARAIAVKFLMDSFRSCGEKEFRDSAKMLSAFAAASITLGEAQMGKQLLDDLIEAHEKMQANKSGKAVAIDLTQAYIPRVIMICEKEGSKSGVPGYLRAGIDHDPHRTLPGRHSRY